MANPFPFLWHFLQQACVCLVLLVGFYDKITDSDAPPPIRIAFGFVIWIAAGAIIR